jgi:hypothetical protein
MTNIKLLVEQAIRANLSEADVGYNDDIPPLNQHPEVRDLRSKGYSVYVSKIHREDPHVVHEVEKDGDEVVVIRQEGDGKYYLRTGAYGALGKEPHDTLQGAVDRGFHLAKTGNYPSINRYP